MNHANGAGPDDVRVLFVDDDPSVADMYKLKLRSDRDWNEKTRIRSRMRVSLTPR